MAFQSPVFSWETTWLNPLWCLSDGRSTAFGGTIHTKLSKILFTASTTFIVKRLQWIPNTEKMKFWGVFCMICVPVLFWFLPFAAVPSFLPHLLCHSHGPVYYRQCYISFRNDVWILLVFLFGQITFHINIDTKKACFQMSLVLPCETYFSCPSGEQKTLYRQRSHAFVLNCLIWAVFCDRQRSFQKSTWGLHEMLLSAPKLSFGTKGWRRTEQPKMFNLAELGILSNSIRNSTQSLLYVDGVVSVN